MTVFSFLLVTQSFWPGWPMDFVFFFFSCKFRHVSVFFSVGYSGCNFEFVYFIVYQIKFFSILFHCGFFSVYILALLYFYFLYFYYYLSNILYIFVSFNFYNFLLPYAISPYIVSSVFIHSCVFF